VKVFITDSAIHDLVAISDYIRPHNPDRTEPRPSSTNYSISAKRPPNSRSVTLWCQEI
jgi:hypothetical protein